MARHKEDEIDIMVNPLDFITDVAGYAKNHSVTERTVKNWCKDGRIPCKLIGNSYAIVKSFPKPNLPIGPRRKSDEEKERDARARKLTQYEQLKKELGK